MGCIVSSVLLLEGKTVKVARSHWVPLKTGRSGKWRRPMFNSRRLTTENDNDELACSVAALS